MPSLIAAIPTIQACCCAIIRVFKRVIPRGKKKPPVVEIKLGFVGTGWCITADKYVVTAQHVLNDGKPRDPNDRFFAFSVPGNGLIAHCFPVVGFSLEDQANDIAVLELGACDTQGQHIPILPITFQRPQDGTIVATYGFPSPEIHGANVDPNTLQYRGGQAFLKGHANEGIISAQYDFNGGWHYEFNVGWHHGESGGPVLLLEPLAVFAVMQHYRTIQAPHGVMAGPHRGRSLDGIRQTLQQLGTTII